MGMELTRAYSTLGVAQGARREDVRAAYRKQLLRNHPDGGGPGDPSALAEIRSAYRTIVDRAAPVRAERRGAHVDVYA